MYLLEILVDYIKYKLMSKKSNKSYNIILFNKYFTKKTYDIIIRINLLFYKLFL